MNKGKTMMSRLVLGIGMFCALLAGATARTINVPADFTTIQAAVDATSTGDEVVVSPGLYPEKIEIHKEITLHSTFDGHNREIIKNTIIKPSSAMPFAISIAPNILTPVIIRGFTITRDPIQLPPPFFSAQQVILEGVGIPPNFPFSYVFQQGISGGGSPATIEYNIIENQVHLQGSSSLPAGYGGAIYACNGVIQNNIFRNNAADIGSALALCKGGVIRNNVFYNNYGTPIQGCSSKIINNTLYNNGSARLDPNNPNASPDGGIVQCNGPIINNILWRSFDTQVAMENPGAPQNCLIQGYSGPGTGNLTGDPRFVDPAHGDFRLRPDSPAIDAGQSTATLTTDFDGNARGKVWRTQGALGDGSHIDIGAFEFQPGALTLWTPTASEPGVAGRPLTIAWALADGIAPGSFNVSLWRGGASVAALGVLAATAGHATYETAGRWTAALPGGIPAAADYQLMGLSVAGDPLQARSAPFAIDVYSAIAAISWNQYR